jgi:formylglycine-generating enzyme required for sulfatase activity
MVDAVNELAALYPMHRYIVTCRPYAYIGQPWKLADFHEVTLAPFSEDQIERFIGNWYEQLAGRGRIERPMANEKARRLREAVGRRDLLGLAERPLLLTVMAQLHAYAGQLPEDRTQLYADAVQLLLQRWESRLGAENGILEFLNVPNLKMSDLESGLYEVAFRAHSVSEVNEGTTDISEGQLREWLARYLNKDWNKAGLFVEYIRERAGLLIRHKVDAYTFPHRSFQEFLAACYWLGLDDYPSEAARMVHVEPERWREVFVLASGYAARTKRLGQAIAAVNALLPTDCKPNAEISGATLQASLLAGQALVEIGLVGVRREPAGLAVLERAQGWLLTAIRGGYIEAQKRAEAGRVLARLGDPRPEVLTCERMAFCHVPAGKFIFGEGKGQKTLDLPEYWIGKYLVTNAQFKQFVDARGYHDPAYWQEAAEAGYWSEAGFKGRLDDEIRAAPVDYGEPFNLPNHPVVGVSWYEALAFTRWLTEQLRVISNQFSVSSNQPAPLADGWDVAFRQGLSSGKLTVKLPSEEQWEKAARGADGRKYSWGEEFDPNKANTQESGIGATSAVGCFVGGESPYGLLDASGNVWEWTDSWYDKDQDTRVLRGGSFFFNSEDARCAYRNWDVPDYGLWYFGFRIVVSPLLLS